MNNSELNSYDKNDMLGKVNVLVRLHEAMQEKLKITSCSEPIQTLTLVPDKWPRMYCSEYFDIFEYLVWTSHEIEKVGQILVKPAPKIGKAFTTETLHLVTNLFEDDNSVSRCFKKKDYVTVSKGVHQQKLCNLQKSL